jgi:uncharacterized protein (TIGR03086 family)
VDVIDALQRATEEYRSRMRKVHSSNQWESPTPCDRWTVRDVADHILGGNRFTVMILHGLAPDDAMDRVIHGDFADEPIRAFDKSSSEQLAAFRRPGVLDRLHQHPIGLISGRRIAALRMSDLVVHGWDLARALGLPEELDPDLVIESIAVFQELAENPAAADFFGPGASGTLPDGAPNQSKLLEMVGRRP